MWDGKTQKTRETGNGDRERTWGMAVCHLQKAIVHTFPSSGDADQNPYVFDVCSNSENLLAVSACGPGHVIKVYDKTALTCVAQVCSLYA